MAANNAEAYKEEAWTLVAHNPAARHVIDLSHDIVCAEEGSQRKARLQSTLWKECQLPVLRVSIAATNLQPLHSCSADFVSAKAQIKLAAAQSRSPACFRMPW